MQRCRATDYTTHIRFFALGQRRSVSGPIIIITEHNPVYYTRACTVRPSESRDRRREPVNSYDSGFRDERVPVSYVRTARRIMFSFALIGRVVEEANGYTQSTSLGQFLRDLFGGCLRKDTRQTAGLCTPRNIGTCL